MPNDLLSRLASRRLLVVTGKGGVGKTAVTACLGRLLSRVRGGKTLVFEVDPRENLHQMLGVAPSGGEVLEVVPGRLYLQNSKSRRVVDEIVRERVKLEAIVRRVLGSPVYQHFAEGAPGLQEVAVLGHALRLLRGLTATHLGPFDRVILDAPATGHGLRLLEAPGLLSEVIERGPFGEMGRELAEFVADREATGVVVVTQAEEMPVQEALELLASLEERFSRRPELVVVNGLYPEGGPDGGRAAGAKGGGAGTEAAEVAALVAERRRVNEGELARLAGAYDGPRADLPLLPVDRGPELVERLSECLRRGVEAAGAGGAEGGR